MTFALYFYEREVLIVSELNAVSKATIILRGFDYNQRRVSVPGAFTPTEAYECFKSGADIVKIFPAAVVSPRFFKDIKAPIPDFKLMAVGGVNIQNSQKFLELGADYLGIGSGMFDKKDIVEGNYEGLKNRIAMLEHEIYRCK
jgi:2-dehydro-3-deoxyphosphogluconate aldolase / (4S)-4-hydroxy-2-oxoglutarate aldolase